MSYRAGMQMIDTHTRTDTDIGDDNTRRPKLVSGKNEKRNYFLNNATVEFWESMNNFLSIFLGVPLLNHVGIKENPC